MNFSEDAGPSTKRLIGIGAVILLHIVLIYALVSGLAQDMFKAVQAPVEMKIIQQVKPPPPPPPKPKEPPKPLKLAESKPVEQPKPKQFIPKPETKVEPQPEQPKTDAQSDVKTKVDTTKKPEPVVTPQPEKPKGKTKGVGGTVSANCPNMDYPQEAQQNEEQGTVRLRLQVGTDGRVTDAKIIKSANSRILDRYAMTMFKKCKFEPALQDGSPVSGTIDLEYVYKLD